MRAAGTGLQANHTPCLCCGPAGLVLLWSILKERSREDMVCLGTCVEGVKRLSYFKEIRAI